MNPLSRWIDIFSQIMYAIVTSIFPPRENTSLANTYTTEEMYQCVAPIRYGDHIALMKYQTPAVRYCIRSLKYEKYQKSISFAADILREFIIDEYQERELLEKMNYLLCTVPETAIRSQKDGYNHLHTILSNLRNELADMPIEDARDLLYWSRPVDRQSTLKRRERIKNVKGAMKARQQVPPHTICFVFDDITTTGATLNEARRTLYECGAAEVISFALAH